MDDTMPATFTLTMQPPFNAQDATFVQLKSYCERNAISLYVDERIDGSIRLEFLDTGLPYAFFKLRGVSGRKPGSALFLRVVIWLLCDAAMICRPLGLRRLPSPAPTHQPIDKQSNA